MHVYYTQKGNNSYRISNQNPNHIYFFILSRRCLCILVLCNFLFFIHKINTCAHVLLYSHLTHLIQLHTQILLCMNTTFSVDARIILHTSFCQSRLDVSISTFRIPMWYEYNLICIRRAGYHTCQAENDNNEENPHLFEWMNKYAVLFNSIFFYFCYYHHHYTKTEEE